MVHTQSKGKLYRPGLQRACEGTGISDERTQLTCPICQSFPEHFLTEQTQTPGLILYLLPSRSHSPACQHTSLSSSLTREQRVNHSANTVALGFWRSSEDLPFFQAPSAARTAAYHPYVNIEFCVPNWRGLTPNCL